MKEEGKVWRWHSYLQMKILQRYHHEWFALGGTYCIYNLTKKKGLKCDMQEKKWNTKVKKLPTSPY